MEEREKLSRKATNPWVRGYEIAVSYSSSQLRYVRKLDKKLREVFDRKDVFFDKAPKIKAGLVGVPLATTLPTIYKQSKVTVVVLGSDYAKKSWPWYELQHILAELATEGNFDRLYVIREGGVVLPSPLATYSYAETSMEISTVVAELVERVRRIGQGTRILKRANDLGKGKSMKKDVPKNNKDGKKKDKDVYTLRDVLKGNKACSERFAEAEALAKSIFNKKRHKNIVPLPFYTEHGEGHCKAVESFLDKIIWKNGDGVLDEKHDFIPSPEEAMYLLSATWLHDIGMWYGIFDNEKPGDVRRRTRVIKLREEHEVRAARYILEKWAKDCSWESEEKDWLCNICVYHRGHIPMSSFEPVKTTGCHMPDRQIRLSVLAALLRLADACHVDKRRAPQRVMGLYISLGMPREARVHWERADLIKDVEFGHDKSRIILKGHYPRKFDFGLREFDVREVGEMICENVQRELRSVQQTLLNFSNTDFREVRHSTYRIRAKDYLQKQQCLRLWPYLLSRPFSATEAAAALAQMLLLSTEQAQESGDLDKVWHSDMRQMMEKTKSLREQDFMIRNLCIGVEKLLSGLAEDAESAGELSEYLTEFMDSVKKNCEETVSYALKEIKPGDALILYGHSVNIGRVLNEIDKRHFLYIVDCYKPLEGHRVVDENNQIIRSAENSGFANKYLFLQLESLSAALGELKRKKVPCKVLLGTHGRLKGGDLLCKVGSYTIARMAKEFGAAVVAFCETTKFLSKNNRIKDEEIAGPEELFSSEDEKKHPVLVDVPYVAPKMDRVPKELVDMVITEKGVERQHETAGRGAGARKRGTTGKKGSKAR